MQKMNFSEYDYNEVTNSPNDGKTFGRNNVYYLKLINETAFEITVSDVRAAEIRIPANKSRTFPGNPVSTFEVALKVRFNNAAPSTDFLTIITLQTNGRHAAEC